MSDLSFLAATTRGPDPIGGPVRWITGELTQATLNRLP